MGLIARLSNMFNKMLRQMKISTKFGNLHSWLRIGTLRVGTQCNDSKYESIALTIGHWPIVPLKRFSFLLRVSSYVTFAHVINTDVWQAMVARAIESQKNCSKLATVRSTQSCGVTERE